MTGAAETEPVSTANRGRIARAAVVLLTLASLVLDSTGNLDAWCCGHAPASGHAPAYSWDILHFF